MKILSFFFWQDIIALGVCSLGGSSSSSAATTTATTNTDKRLVVDNAATGITADNSTVNITDQGALKVAGNLANNALIKGSDNLALLLETTQKLATSAMDAAKTNTSFAQTMATSTQSAYSDAASLASGNKNLVLAALAVVGLVGVSFLTKKA